MTLTEAKQHMLLAQDAVNAVLFYKPLREGHRKLLRKLLDDGEVIDDRFLARSLRLVFFRTARPELEARLCELADLLSAGLELEIAERRLAATGVFLADRWSPSKTVSA